MTQQTSAAAGPGATEVLIVGAGPTGLSLGLELHRFGVRFRIIDKNIARSTTSKAIGLQPRLSEIFAVLGVAEKLFASGFSDIRGVNFCAGARKVLSFKLENPPDQAGREAFQPRMIIIPQSETERILEETLHERGIRVERGVEFLEFQQTADAVISRARHADGTEESIPSQFLISCEGAHSVIRKQAGLGFVGKAYPLRFVMADVAIDWDLPADQVHIWFHSQGSLGALPFGAGRWRVIVECAQADEPEAEVTLDLIQNFLAERTANAAIRARDPVWLTDFRINCRMVDRFRAGRIFVAGDAAHIHSPTGGQGIATGVQDATNLAWKIAAVLNQNAPDALLDTFSEERLPIAREVLERTDAMSKIFFATNPLARFFRERLLLPLLRIPFAQRRMFGKFSQLQMNYRQSSLCLHQDRQWFGSRIRVRAGDRAPDVVFESTGNRVTLFELLTPGKPVVLMNNVPNPNAVANALERAKISAFEIVSRTSVDAPSGRLRDMHGDFFRLYGAEGEFIYLIRPDGYVDFFQRPANVRRLVNYLEKIRDPKEIERIFELQ